MKNLECARPRTGSRLQHLFRYAAAAVLLLPLLTAQAAVTVVSQEQNAVSNEITFVGAGTAATAGSGNVTPGLPAGVAVNDILICVVESRDNVVSSMTGWTLLNGANSGTGHRASLFWRRATASNPTTVTHSGGNGIGARIMAFRGVSTTTAFDVANSFTVSFSDTTTEAAAISTVTANTMLVFTQHMGENFSSVATPTGSAPWTEAFFTEYDPGGNNNDLTISAHYGLRTATGSQPALQAQFSPTGGRSGVSHGAQLALRPATTLAALSVNVPAGTTSDDVMVAAIAVKPSTITITPPSGWVSINRVEQTAGESSAQEIFYRVVTGSEPASYTWNFSAPVLGAAGGIVTYRGASTVSPIDNYGGNVTPSATTHTANSINTTVVDAMVVTAHSFSSAATWTPPTGMTERVDVASLTVPNAGGIALEISDVVQASAGATGNKTATASGNADTGVAHILALRPDVSTPILIGEWRMNETSWNGTAGEVLDYSGNGLNGASVNGANTELLNPAIAGSPGTCRYGNFISSGNQYLQIGNDPLLNINNKLTVTAWINPATLPGSDLMTIVSKNNNYELHLKPSGVLSWTWNNASGTARSFDSTTAISASDTSGPYGNGWHHIAVVYNHSTQIIYINGSPLSNPSTYLNENLQTTSTPLLLGADQDTPGRAFNGQIDQVRVYANKILSAAEISAAMTATVACPVDIPHHYAISFPNGNSGSACVLPAVEITAHDSSERTLNVPAATLMSFSTSTGLGIWGPAGPAPLAGTGTWTPSGNDDGLASYNWPGGEYSVRVELSHTTDPAVNINLSDGVATDRGDGGAEDPSLIFSLVPIIRISSDGNSLTPINTQIAGKSSSQAPGQTLYIQLKQSGITVGGRDGCEVPGEYSGTATVTVALECIDPASCSGQQPVVNGTTVTTLYASGTVPSPLTGTGVSFTFDGSSGSDVNDDNKAGLVFSFADAGKVRLHFSVTMDPPGPTSLTPLRTFTGNSEFDSRPFGYSLESSDPNIYAADASGTVFRKSGSGTGADFDLKVRAVVWESADDADQNGMPDAGAPLTNNSVTPNYGNEVTHVTASITHSLVAPLPGGEPGILSGGTGIDGFNSDGGDGDANNTNLNPGETTATLAFSEVGIINLTAVTQGYLGTTGVNVQGVLTNVGRFVPDRFGVSANSPVLQDVCSAGPTPFTYLDQSVFFTTPPVLTVTALNTAGNVTKNYGGNFWKLNSSLSARTYSDQVGGGDHGFAGAPLSAVILNGNTDYDGIGTLATAGGSSGDVMMYTRINPEAPFAAAINLNFPAADLTDPDGVCYDLTDDGTCDVFTIANIAGASLRFGRLGISKEISSEVIDLNVPITAEYYNGTGYVVNTDDQCTGIAATDLTLSNTLQTAETDSDIQICEAGGTSTMTVTNNPFAAGDGLLAFTAPGAACEGFTDILIDLSGLGLDHLRYDWDDEDGMNDGPYDDNPAGRATFGILSRPKEVIYTREPWN